MNTGSESLSVVPNNDNKNCDRKLATVVVNVTNSCYPSNDTSTPTPSELRHNSLNGLQGGTPQERYHLTRAQYDAINNSGFILLSGTDFESDTITYNNVRLKNTKYTLEYIGNNSGGGSWDRGILIPGVEYSNLSTGGFKLNSPYIATANDRFQVSYLTTIAGLAPPSLQNVTDTGNISSNAILLTGNNNVAADDGVLLGRDGESASVKNIIDGAVFSSLILGDSEGNATVLKHGIAALRFQTDGGRVTFDRSNGTVKIPVSGADAVLNTDFVTLAQLNAAATPAVTVSNGLTRVGNNIKLGGVLVDPFTIIGDQDNTALVITPTSVAINSFQPDAGVTNGGGFAVYSHTVTMSVSTDVASGKLKGIQISKGTANGILIQDTEANIGLVYDADVSAKNTGNPRWIVDKGYVDGKIASIAQLTFNNGLTRTNDNVQLGGPITTGITIGVANANANMLKIANNGGQGIEMLSYGASTFVQSRIKTQYSAVSMSSISGSGVAEIAISNLAGTGLVITDSLSSKGMVYAGNYSVLGKQDVRWIPDWGNVTVHVLATTIQNATTLQPSANFNIDGTGRVKSLIVGGTYSFQDNIGISVYNAFTNVSFAYGYSNNIAIDDGVTNVIGYASRVAIRDGFTVASVKHFLADGTVVGTGSALTTMTGFEVLTGAARGVTNYGFRSSISTKATNWNLYLDGSAQNYIQGRLGLGVQLPTEQLDVLNNGKFGGTLTSSNLRLTGGGATFVQTISAGFSTTLTQNATTTLPNITGAFTVLSDIGATPTPTSPGLKGETRYGGSGNYYICVATDTWIKCTGVTTW